MKRNTKEGRSTGLSLFLQTNDIAATLQQYVGGPDVTAQSPLSGDELAAGDNHTLPPPPLPQPQLHRRRRSWKNHDHDDDGGTTTRNDDWIRLMRNVLWKNRRRRNTETGFRTRRSTSSSSLLPSFLLLLVSVPHATPPRRCRHGNVGGKTVANTSDGDWLIDVDD